MPNAFPTLQHAVANIARDNGMYRQTTVDRALALLKAKYPEYVLDAVDRELAALTPAQFDSVTVGEQGVVPVSTTLETVLNAVAEDLL